MLADSILTEFRNEATPTRRLLERLPDDRLTWKPHPKSRSLGELATHVARLPSLAARIIDADEFTPTPVPPPACLPAHTPSAPSSMNRPRSSPTASVN